MINNIKKLLVKYNGLHVGYLVELENDIAFQYTDYWLKYGFSISPLSLPLLKKTFINKKDNFGGLFGVFFDSLPDGWGNLLLRRKLGKHGINYERLSSLTKLSLVSKVGLGTLEYEPIQMNEEEQQRDYDLDNLANDAYKIFSSENEVIDIDNFYRLGGSSGGSRPKIHIKIEDEDWIIKFPCSYDPKEIGFKEYIANDLAKKCDINVNEFKLFSSKLCKGYFGCKRFDRNNNKRIHMISLSSLLETSHLIPNLDYLHLFQVISLICVDKEDLYEAYKRMCFNVLYGNKDDHGKNFAFLYDENLKGYKLSPFYDITNTQFKYEHEMSVNGNGNPDENDLLEVAKKCKLSFDRCVGIINKIKRIIK